MRIMELRQLRYFVAVAEELHFRRAAARLHVSQPPLSQQIQRLENELGCRLLARTRRRVQLTPAGEAFLRDARAMLAELDAAVNTARRIDAGQTGRLRVNFVGSALLSIVPGAVQRFRAAHPSVEIELRERPTVEQLRAVAAGVVDVGLVRPPVDSLGELHAETVLRERTVAALPTDHPLARLRRVPVARLANEPLVLFPRAQAPGYHDLLVATIPGGGEVVQYAPEMQTIIGLVAAGIGVALAPESVERLGLHGVTYRPAIGAPRSDLIAVTRAEDPSPLVRGFVAEARVTPARRRAPARSSR
jgi:DNA-binding transcriptional LysR family regulator